MKKSINNKIDLNYSKPNISPEMARTVYEYISKFAVTKIYFQEQDITHELILDTPKIPSASNNCFSNKKTGGAV